MDEAATHGPDPCVTMGGLLGHAYEWRRFGIRLKRIQDKYGFTVFHSKDFKAHKGEFKGWPNDAYYELITELSDLIKDTLSEGVTISLPREMYLAEYRSAPIPKGMPLDSQYGCCFRGCISHVADLLLTERNTGKNHQLDVVIEDGHKNAGDTVRIFDDIKDSLEERNHYLLGTITRAKKIDAPPLMLADFIAHTHYMMDKSAATGGPSYRNFSQEIPIKRYEASLTYMNLTPGALVRAKERWASEKVRKMATWRAARDARKASEAIKTKMLSSHNPVE